jgi:AraC-like DNA-binding protein
MHYREFQPQPSLARFIECFWTLESESNLSESEPDSILPDGCVELILNFSAPFRELKEGGKEEEQPVHFVVGQMTHPVSIAPTGAVKLLGIRFHPGGTLPFFRIPMHELTNQIVELNSIDGKLAAKIVVAASSSPTPSLQIAAIEACLADRANSCDSDSGITGLAASAVRLGGRITVEKLSESAGIIGRQMERRFLREIGIGPKLFCRILRFQQVFRAVEHESMGWAAIAAECGYYDQAHLIRDFQQFARQTPAVFLTQSGQLTEAFTRKHRGSQ